MSFPVPTISVPSPILPPDLRVPEVRRAILRVDGDDGVVGGFGEGEAVLGGPGDALRLLDCLVVVVCRVEEGEDPIVVYRRAGEAAGLVALVRGKGNPLVAPMDEVPTGGVPPVHGTPFRRVWVELVEEVVDPIELDQAIRIVDPPTRGGDVVCRFPDALFGLGSVLLHEALGVVDV